MSAIADLADLFDVGCFAAIVLLWLLATEGRR